MPGHERHRGGALAWPRRAQIVFVTAYEQYAVQAFEQGAIDYLVKPFDEARLADTVQRLRERAGAAPGPPADAGRSDALLDRLAGELRGRRRRAAPMAAVDQGLGGHRRCG